MKPTSVALSGALAVAALLASAGAQQGGRLDERHDFGPAAIDFEEPPVTTPAPAVCPLGPAAGAGTLQFSRPDYVTDETVGIPFVLVTRTGGSAGAVSGSVITSDGSAESGADYTAVSTTVRFEDGDYSPRLVEIPILQDDVVEPDETFEVSLLDPNCVASGDQTTAEVTIAGVPDQPNPETFTIGGTSGAEGGVVDQLRVGLFCL